jgi:dTMP kinase
VARGALVVLEGAEGVGKTTQLSLLRSRLERAGVATLAVREPGGTVVGDEIRRLLLDDPHRHIAPRAEALLFMASRAQLVDEIVRPAVLGGTFVLADRFFLSTYAYQIVGRGLDEAEVRAANAFAAAGVVPDLTILLDLAPGDGLARAGARGGHDRMEQSGDDFHRRVALAFRTFAEAAWQAAHPECGPVTLVDASGGPEEVATRVWNVLDSRWHETLSAEQPSHR